MGAWGHGSFENDDAGDWTYALEEEDDSGFLQSTLEEVTKLPASEDLESSTCSDAIAAAEVVAALLGRPMDELPENVIEWVEAHRGRHEPTLAPTAIAALTRIRTKSELKDLWEEDDAKPWLASLDELERRLKG
jgi:hypothetical protein